MPWIVASSEELCEGKDTVLNLQNSWKWGPDTAEWQQEPLWDWRMRSVVLPVFQTGSPRPSGVKCQH